MSGDGKSPVITVGIIGTGRLAGYIVEGARGGATRNGRDFDFLLSPRNAEKAADLAARFGARLAADNQAVVDGADLVLLAVRPPQAEEGLKALRFRAGQIVISAIAGVTHAAVAKLVAPARVVCVMLPGRANAEGIGLSILYPKQPEAEAFLARLGPVHGFDDWPSFEVASVVGGLSGCSFHFLKHMISWFTARGLDARTAALIVAETLRGNAGVVQEHPEELDAIIAGIQTPGGVTQCGAELLAARGGLDDWNAALDAMQRHMWGAEPEKG